MAAALAFYAIFALAPVLLIALSIAGRAFGDTVAAARLRAELDVLVGPTLEFSIERILASYRWSGGGPAIVSLLLLAVGGSGIFVELRDSLDVIFGRPGGRRPSFLRLLARRATGFAMVLVGSIALLVGMGGSIAIQGLLNDAAQIPYASIGLGIAATLFVFALATLCLTLVYRQLPRPKPAWMSALAGALGGALLFVAGEFVLSIYLARIAPSASAGAAGAVLAVLIWVYYSARIVYFGAEIARAHAAGDGEPTITTP